MKERNHPSKQNSEKGMLPVHSLDNDSKKINILPLDHNNPYDFKREHRHTYFEIMLIKKGGCNQLIDFKNYIGQVIHNRILLEAKRLLLFEEITHKEISYQLGFDSPPSFSAFIKSKTGYSPSELTQHLAEIHK